MVLGMFRIYRPIVGIAFRVLGWRVGQWVADYLRFSWAAMQAAGVRKVGAQVVRRMADDLPPRWRLALIARLEEWRVMGWV